jgi:predicted dehydrogenase
MIAHNQRFDAAHLKAKEILSNGELGRIICFKSSFSHKGPELWSIAKSVNTWFFNKNEAALGVVVDLGIHKADLMRWLIQDEIDEVVAMVMTLDKKDIHGQPIEIDDNAMCILRSKTGIAGTISVGWTNYGNGYRDNGTTLFCTEGVMRINESPEYPLEIIRRTGDKELYQFKQNIMEHGQVNSGVIDQFVKCIKTQRKPEISGEEGLAALKIILACMESSATEKKVPII